MPHIDNINPQVERSAHPRIEMTGISKSFVRASGQRVNAIDDVDLAVNAGEFLVLLGPSGCGKTTLLRVLAGLEMLNDGRVRLDGTTVEDVSQGLRVPTERRRLSMMFQSYALWPHLTVFQNVEYPLTARKMPKQDRHARVEAVLRAVGIEDLGSQRPSHLSGGQQQRVALARSVVSGDGIILFDEPLSNVDAKIREQLRAEIQRLHREIGFTAVYVTHDQEEALMLGTRILVLRSGKVAQSGTPREIYNDPVEPYVARFTGGANDIRGRLTSSDGDRAMLSTACGDMAGRAMGPMSAGEDVIVLSRPEAWTVQPKAPPANNVFTAEVTDVRFLGQHSDIIMSVDDWTVRARVQGPPAVAVGDRVEASIDARDLLIYGGRNAAAEAATDE